MHPLRRQAGTAVHLHYVFKARCFGKLPCISKTVTRLPAHQPDIERRAVPTGPSRYVCPMLKQNWPVCCQLLKAGLPKQITENRSRKSLLNKQKRGKTLLPAGQNKLLDTGIELMRSKLEIKEHLRQTSASKSRRLLPSKPLQSNH